MDDEQEIPPQHNDKGYWDLLRALEPGQSVVLPVSQATAGGHAAAVIGKGKYATKQEPSGTRVWRKNFV